MKNLLLLFVMFTFVACTTNKTTTSTSKTCCSSKKSCKTEFEHFEYIKK
jgi:hypothetical protein